MLMSLLVCDSEAEPTRRMIQGSLTTFRDLYIKETFNVDPTIPGLHAPSSWSVKTEADGTLTVTTLGQAIVPEVVAAWKAASVLSYPVDSVISTTGYTPFAQQPTGRHYAMYVSYSLFCKLKKSRN